MVFKVNEKISKNIIRISLGVVIICYFLTPHLSMYGIFYIHIYSLFTLLSFILYIRFKRFENYLNFELLFLTSLLLLFYIYPNFVYNEDTPYLFSFGLEYNTDCIPQGVCIASVGVISFMLGNMKKIPYSKKNNASRIFIKNNRYLSILCTFLYLLYYVMGGFQYFADLYKENIRESSLSSYVLVLIQSAFPLLLFNELWNKKISINYKYSLYVFLLSAALAVHFAMVGSRTNALLILLSFIIIYTEFFSKQSWKRLLIFFVFGILVMWTLQNIRSNTNINSETFKLYMLFSDFLIPNTDTYLAVDIVQKNGISYGLTILSQLLSIIPFAQNFVYSLFGLTIQETSSSHLFTEYIGSSAGMGTNAVADLYLAFGLIGVIICMYYLGTIIYRLKSNLGHYYYSSLFYALFAGLSIFLVRSSIFYSLKFVVYTIFLSLIFSPNKYEKNSLHNNSNI